MIRKLGFLSLIGLTLFINGQAAFSQVTQVAQTFSSGEGLSFSQWKWSSLAQAAQHDEQLTEVITFHFPSGFANGQIAFSNLNANGTRYIVAREDTTIPGLVAADATDKLRFRMQYVHPSQISSYPAYEPSEEIQALQDSGQIISIGYFPPRWQPVDLDSIGDASIVKLSSGQDAYIKGAEICTWGEFDYSNNGTRGSWQPSSPSDDQFSFCVESNLSREENLAVLDSIVNRRNVDNTSSTMPSNASPLESLSGTWEGSYICSQGTTNLRLVIDAEDSSNVLAAFIFSPSYGNPHIASGSFRMSGTYSSFRSADNPDRLELYATDWIDRPEGYLTVNLSGNVFPSEERIVGRITTTGCSTFEVFKR